MKSSQFVTRALLLLMMATGVSACATAPNNGNLAPSQDPNAVNDPLEPMNRVFFDVNDFLDRLLFRPLAGMYRLTVPPIVRDRVAGILENMDEPVTFANNVLQGRMDRAQTTLVRFVVNTTAGVGGMFDVANDYMDKPKQQGDFGETLHVWGIKQGPYLVLPLFGPSNFRDGIGRGVDMAMTPWGYIVAAGSTATENRFWISSTAADALTQREKNIEAIDNLKKGSLDFYAQMRSVYTQYRNKQLGVTGTQPVPNFDEEYGR